MVKAPGDKPCSCMRCLSAAEAMLWSESLGAIMTGVLSAAGLIGLSEGSIGELSPYAAWSPFRFLSDIKTAATVV